MSELLTLQDLANGHLDVKALGEAANGDENTIVTTRTGNTYPSAERAINTMFKNGGLPATPFKTKALMTASSLANDKYAMVTDDTVNNGLYLKVAGAWVKSGYDPVVQSKAHTDTAKAQILVEAETATLPALTTINQERVEIVDVIGQASKNSRISNTDGTLYYSLGYSASDFIAVKTGESFIIKRYYVSHIANLVALSVYDNAKQNLGFISYVEQDLTLKDKLNNVDLNYADSNVQFNLSSRSSSKLIDAAYTQVFTAKEDGFIRIGYRDETATDAAIFSTKDAPIKVFKVSKLNLVEQKQVMFDNAVMNQIKGVINPLTVDYATAKIKGALSGGYYSGTHTIGKTMTYTNTRNEGMSTKIEVKKGQYLHAHSQGLKGKKALIINSSDVILDVVRPLQEQNTDTGKYSAHVFTNYLIKEDGYLVIPVQDNGFISCFYALTDEKISVEPKYLRSNQSIEFFKYIGKSKSPTLNGLSTSPVKVGFTNFESETGSNSESTTSTITDTANGMFLTQHSKPYRLKRGDVLRYRARMNDPTLAVVMPVTTTDTSNVIGMRLLDTTVLDSNAYRQAYKSDSSIATKNIYVNDAVDSEVFYCNEDEDMFVVFYRPSPVYSSFVSKKQSLDYSVDVMSIEGYKKYRDNNIGLMTKPSHIFTSTGTNSDTSSVTEYSNIVAMQPWMVWSKPLLVFKGEMVTQKNRSNSPVAVYSLTRNLNSSEVLDNYRYFVSAAGGTSITPYDSTKDTTYSETHIIVEHTGLYTTGTQVFLRAATSFDETDILHPESLLKTKVVDFSTAKLGVDYSSMSIPATVGHNFDNLEEVKVSINSNGVTKSVFAKKGVTYLLSSWTRLLFSGFQSLSNNGSSNFLRIFSRDVDGVLIPETGVSNYFNVSNHTGVFTAPDDGLIVISSLVPSTLSALYLATNDFSIVEVGADEVKNSFTPTKELTLSIPTDIDLNFNIFGLLPRAGSVELPALVQIRSGEKVLYAVNTVIANQGQSSASNYQQNINMEFYNHDWSENVSIKFGDSLPIDQWVLKSYYRTDRPHVREAVSSELWYNMRGVGSVNKSPLPESVFSDPSIGYSRHEAKCTPAVFPTTAYTNGRFFGVYTCRTKKDRSQFAVVKGNKNHILMQADRELAPFKWSELSLANFEVRNPKMSDYTAGDITLPANYSDIQTKTATMLNWAKNATTSESTAIEQYKDYFNKNSLLDFSIFVAVARHWDGNANNFFLASWDGGDEWHVHHYDGDQTWGGYGAGGFYQNPYNNVAHEYGGLFSAIYSNAVTFEDVKYRYKELREAGVISIDWVKDRFKHYNSRVNADLRQKNEEMWEATVNYEQTLEYSMNWSAKHFRYMDAMHSYLPSDSLLIKTLAFTFLKVNVVKSFNFSVPGVKIGDFIRIEVGDLHPELAVSYEIVADNSVVVNFTSTSVSGVSQNSYIRLYK